MRALIVLMLLAGVAAADPAPAGGSGSSSSGSNSSSSGSNSSSSDDASNGFKTTKGAFGLGLLLGEPTAICAKLYLANDRAIDAAAGATFIAPGLQFHADYLFHPVILQDRDSFVMPLYVGPGIRFIDYSGSNSYFAAGLRGVVGLAFDFKSAPIDAFVEAAIVVETGFTKAHDIGAAVNAGVGARYYF